MKQLQLLLACALLLGFAHSLEAQYSVQSVDATLQISTDRVQKDLRGILMPTVAKNQKRPLRVVNNDCDPITFICNPDDGDGEGGGAGTACKCERVCENPGGTTGCPLSTNACYACKAFTGGACESCTGPNNCGC